MTTLPIFRYTNTLHGQSWIKLRYLTKYDWPARFAVMQRRRKLLRKINQTNKQTRKKESKRKKKKQRKKQLKKDSFVSGQNWTGDLPRVRRTWWPLHYGNRCENSEPITFLTKIEYNERKNMNLLSVSQEQYDHCVTVYLLNWLLPAKYLQWEVNPCMPSAQRKVCKFSKGSTALGRHSCSLRMVVKQTSITSLYGNILIDSQTSAWRLLCINCSASRLSKRELTKKQNKKVEKVFF